MPAPSETFNSVCALIEDLTSNAGSVQQRVLCDILAQNSHTEYLRKIAKTARGGAADDVRDVISPHTFKCFAPLITYEDLQPSIQRIQDGDKSPILTALPVTKFFESSGTSSGIPTLFPAFESDSERVRLLFLYAASVTRQYVEGLDDGKEVSFFCAWPEEWTAGGILKEAISTSLLKSPWMREHIKKKHTTPVEVMVGSTDVSQSTYCQLLCALIQRQEVVDINSTFASAMLRVIYTLQERWPELVKDIHSGSLSESVVLDPTMRNAMEALIDGPNPTLAMLVEEECCREPRWQGIIRRLWPCAKYVACIATGSMEQYIPALEFFLGGLPLLSKYYVASECMFGINMSPMCNPYEVSYTILPNMAYFEFLPLEADLVADGISLDKSHLVDLVDVKLGKEYEIVVTTFSGLYRYQIGDVLRVTGFYNKAPQFRMVGRKNVVLSVDLDKTDERTLQRALEVAKSNHLEVGCAYQLVDYTSYTDVSTIPGHYVLFWEVISCGSDGAPGEMLANADVFEACCAAMEECFDSMYRLGRASLIGPLEIRVVKPGSFCSLMDCIVETGVRMTQYKTPRSLKLTHMIELLNSKVSHSFFSPTSPTPVILRMPRLANN